MKKFFPLSQILFKHPYYRDGNFRDFSITPTAASKRLLRSVDIFLKMEQASVSLFYSDQTIALLDIDNEKVTFSFFLELQDPNFLLFTELPIFNPNEKIFSFTNTHKQPSSDSITLLHDTEFVEEESLIEKDHSIPHNMIGLITIELDVQKAIENNGFEMMNYEIRFKNRAVYWRYHIIDHSNISHSYRITSEAKNILFTNAGLRKLSNGDTAVVMTSEKVIELKEQYDFSLTLEVQMTKQKTNIVLPFADPSSVKVESDEQFYADMYIYL